ncbi:mitochondrial dicarboxylate carrier isoform X2 [Halyomorpha halys]|nr:mitochondrial dicarboxylate carrier-like isoform X2 [Halyomorpha halys]XP_024217703.1 mitochondrial dicarboxylate carrier-like isoform X2 [Halyomorpha halys]XP_024217704.1 mitochondrial dicarboxylate carrier-like isoform X2 [Halyomorpha halys]XP_024217705.1 mitochondrial dicarboxylate carrier-like isoform X2 [Halyomorpha halys]
MGEKRMPKWYFGGMASAGAACFTHPLDLIKVQLQTQQENKVSLFRLVSNMIKNDGFFSFYNGISASLLRQMTYSTARFGIYEIGKEHLSVHGEAVPFAKTVLVAGMAGAAGGILGTPADLVNVRMQNDMKLPREQRRNYKNAIDGLYRVAKEEGALKMFNGLSAATSRAIFMTIGQLSFYDLFKDFLLHSGYFTDNPTTHFLSSLGAGGVATTLTQPLDVLKTRAMNAKPGEFKGLMDIAVYTAKLGPLGFFKGYVPAFIRLAPQTILTFMLLEQITNHFGVIHHD